MSKPPAGIPEADWSSWPAGARQLILARQEEIQSLRRENDELRNQLIALATELARLREWFGRSSRNSSKPPSSDGPGFQPSGRRKGRGRKRNPAAGRGSSARGHQVLEIPAITLLVNEHRLHRRVCPCCSTSTCALLPADGEASRYGPRLSSLVGLLGSTFPLRISKTQVLINQLLGVEMSRGAIATFSAPHGRSANDAACGGAGTYNAPFALERLEAFASEFGPRFQGLSLNEGKITLRTIVDLPDPERAQLDALCRQRGLSRAEAQGGLRSVARRGWPDWRPSPGCPSMTPSPRRR